MSTPIIATDNTLREIVYQEIVRLGQDANLNHIDTTFVTNMSELFMDSNFNGTIDQWNVSNVLDMTCMFQDSEFSGDLSRWNVNNVRWFNLCFDASLGNPIIKDWSLQPNASVPLMLNSLSPETMLIFPKMNIADPNRYNQQLSVMYNSPTLVTLRQGSPFLQKLQELPELCYQHGIVALLRPDIHLSSIHPKLSVQHHHRLQQLHAISQHVHDAALNWETLLRGAFPRVDLPPAYQAIEICPTA